MGGFRLTRWMSNIRTLTESVPEEARAKQVRGENLIVESAMHLACGQVDNDSIRTMTTSNLELSAAALSGKLNKLLHREPGLKPEETVL